jgi:hypothetical protein
MKQPIAEFTITELLDELSSRFEACFIYGRLAENPKDQTSAFFRKRKAPSWEELLGICEVAKASFLSEMAMENPATVKRLTDLNEKIAKEEMSRHKEDWQK